MVRRQQLEEEGTEIDLDEERRIKMEFRLIDIDGNGTIDWWEFVKHEATKQLAKRNKVQRDSSLKVLDLSGVCQTNFR